ncbi:ATP-binding protein [Streptacidiphilus sp. N1-3]|uniref:ATP-binding protein n=1 Tax=Streptacidiphilus alkalitolerans TaxID=3342712 RepID=A0ABV6XE77_9ACTN
MFGLGPAAKSLREQEEQAITVPAGKLLLRAVLNLVVAWFVFDEARGPMAWIVVQFKPSLATSVESSDTVNVVMNLLYYGPVALLIAWFFGRMGRWPLVWRRYGRPLVRRVVDAIGSRSGAGTPVKAPTGAKAQGEVVVDPWWAFRPLVGHGGLALLDQETAAGRVGDVDHQRLNRALECVRDYPDRLAALLDAVREHGAAACAHPSGTRDLPGRHSGRHDLLLRQVRLGSAEDVPKNPAAYRGVDLAIDPALLGTSLLAVGPAGTGKTRRLARPLAEALCLQALAGTAVVVVVGAADADLGPAEWYDVVVAPGDPASRYGLDLYGGARRMEEAVARLADALLPEELAPRAESARQALQQVVVPYTEAYGRPPGLRELALLLRGEPVAWDALREALRACGGLTDHQYELAQRERMHGQVDDPGALLADRLSLLDRPALAASFNRTSERGGGRAGAELPLFAMHALDHPLRVRIAVPEHSHPEAARIIARLAVGQFLYAASTRQDRSLFAGLVVDDASAVIDVHSVRSLQRLRGAHAGAALLLRTLMDLPESLRTPLFGAVGGRMAFPGIAPWDGKLFAEAWGTVWVDERDVTRAPDTSGGIIKRSWRAVRTILAGERAQTESVTTRRVERRRWSPSDLAQVLPGGHAVLSLTAVDGTPVPPLLLDLQG